MPATGSPPAVVTLALQLFWPAPRPPPPRRQAGTGPSLGNATCLSCHGAKKARSRCRPPAARSARCTMSTAQVRQERARADGVHRLPHGNQRQRAPHRKTRRRKQARLRAVPPRAGAEAATSSRPPPSDAASASWSRTSRPTRSSFHARPNKDDPAKLNASCNDCHDMHSFNVPATRHRRSAPSGAWPVRRCAAASATTTSSKTGPTRCTARKQSESTTRRRRSAPTATPRTTSATPRPTPVKLAITASCGNCHEDNYKSYKDTYHGQVNTLGYAYTAKCFDCHGSHDILPSKDPKSKVHPTTA